MGNRVIIIFLVFLFLLYIGYIGGGGNSGAQAGGKLPPMHRDILIAKTFEGKSEAILAVPNNLFNDPLDEGLSLSFWIKMDLPKGKKNNTQVDRGDEYLHHILHRGDSDKKVTAPALWFDNKNKKIYTKVATTSKNERGFYLPIDYKKLFSKYIHITIIVMPNQSIIFVDGKQIMNYNYEGKVGIPKGDFILGKTDKYDSFKGTILNLTYSNYVKDEEQIKSEIGFFNPFMRNPFTFLQKHNKVSNKS